jgi:phosphate starvation-inducible protein PhoH and related proteins
MARGKNLTKEDLEDVSTWEDLSKSKNGANGIRINDIKLSVKCLNEKQKELKKAIEENEIVISIGPAGTGKTYLSLLIALHLLKTEPKYRKIVLVKSLQTIKGEELGFLPGTLWEKMEPFMWSFTGNLDKILGDKHLTQQLLQKGIIEVVPLAYIRGVTQDNSIIIVDETQNMELHTFKSMITRIGKSSKMLFLGDVEQIDRKIVKESCLAKVFSKFKESEFVGTVEFLRTDGNARNPIIPKLLDILDKIEE